jgi:hypothetical protein
MSNLNTDNAMYAASHTIIYFSMSIENTESLLEYPVECVTCSRDEDRAVMSIRTH